MLSRYFTYLDFAKNLLIFFSIPVHFSVRRLSVEIADNNSIRASIGFGLSWLSPLGPLRVDFATPVLDEDYDKDEVFRFDFGTRF